MRSKGKYIAPIVLLLIIGIMSIMNNRTEEWLNFKTLNDGRISVRATPSFDLTRDYSIDVFYKPQGALFYKKTLETEMLRDRVANKKLSPEEIKFDISDNEFVINLYEDAGYITIITIDMSTGDSNETVVRNED